jgi:hypothetical protein
LNTVEQASTSATGGAGKDILVMRVVHLSLNRVTTRTSSTCCVEIRVVTCYWNMLWPAKFLWNENSGRPREAAIARGDCVDLTILSTRSVGSRRWYRHVSTLISRSYGRDLFQTIPRSLICYETKQSRRTKLQSQSLSNSKMEIAC